MHNRERAGHFSRGAKAYDQVTPRPFAIYGQRLVDRAALPPDARVLDVATGRGAVLLPAAVRVGSQGHAVGVDLAEGMLNETASDLRRQQLAQATLCRSDACALPFSDDTFDVVLCGHAIWAFPQALYEFHRVLVTEGRLALTTVAQGCFDWVLKAIQAYEGREEPEQEERVPEPPVTTAEGLRARLQEARFDRVQVAEEETVFRYTHKSEWWNSLWTLGTQQTMERLSAEELAGLRRAIYDALEPYQRADGVYIPWRVLYGVGHK